MMNNIKKAIFLCILAIMGVLVVTNTTKADVTDTFCNAGDATITAPEAGSAVKGIVTVGWTFNGVDCTETEPSVLTVQASHDAGASWENLTTSALPTSTSVTFDSTLGTTPDDTDYQFRLNVGGKIVNTTSYSDVAIDNTAPVLLSAVTADDDNNGAIDRIRVALTEATSGMASTCTSTGWTVTADDTTVLTVASCARADATHLDLTITEDAVHAKTDNTPSVAYAATGDTTDRAGNEITAATINASDEAKPAILSAVTGDDDGNGKIDRLVLTFSETVDIADGNGGDGFDGVTLSGGYTIANADYAATDATTLTLIITEGAVDTGATIDPTYTTDGSNTIIDNATNEMATAETVTGTDGAYPIITNSTGSDSDNDGKTNLYTITFSENLTDGGVAAENVNFTARNATTSENITISTVGIGATGASDATKVVLNLDDTDANNYTGVIEFSYNKNGGGVIIEDASAGTLDFADQTNTVLTDDVSPVLLASRGGNTGDTADVLDNTGEIIDFRFSESMNTTLPTIVQLEEGLTFANGATDGTNLGAISTVSLVTLVLSNDTYRVTWGVDSTNLITPGTDTVQVTIGTNIKDNIGVAANTAPAAVTISVADITAPTISSRQTQDLDKDGKIDAIKITFDENILDSTVVATDFVIAGYAGMAFSSTTNSDVADNDVIYITFTEGEVSDTDAVPDITYTQGTLTDSSANLLATVGPVASTDGAAPAAVSAVYKDNGAGKVTTVEITFSEDVTLTSYDADEWTIAEAGTIVLADETNVTAASNVITLTASGNDDITGGATNPQITYTADASNNVNDGTNNTATFTIEVTDSAAPFVAVKKYIDSDGSGTIDGVELTLTENIGTCTSTIDDFVYDPKDVAGSALVSGSIACANNKATLTLGSAGPANTTSVATAPTIAYTDSAERTISDALGNELASFGAGGLTDGAGPVVTAIVISDNSGDGTIDRAVITYSEALQDTASAANGFDVTSVANHGVCDTEGADPTASDSLTLTFVCANKFTAVGDMNIAFTSNAGILDAAGNQSPTKTFTASSTPAMVDGAKPVMVSAATKDSDANGTVDQLLITFSEPVNITDGGTDNDMTLVASSGTASIVAGEYGNANTSTLTYAVLPTATADTAITITPTYSAVSGSIVDLADTPNAMVNGNTIAGTDEAGPAILNSAFTDSDADGNIDRVVLTFSESSTVSDGVAGDGLDSILISDGSSLEIDAADYATTATTLTLNFADHTGTAITGLTVTYSTAGSNAITDGSTEASSGAVSQAYTDNAAPVPLSASINKALSNNNLQAGSVIEVVFSENVTPTGVVNGAWKFARNGFESLASSNWPDGSTVAYATGSAANVVKMTLSTATTSTGWMNGGKLNLNADDTASIVDGSANQADKNSSDILLAGLSGPVISFFGANSITSSSATIAWTTQGNTTVNRVLYDTAANYESDASLDLVSTTGTPGEGTKNHSINLSSLTANTIYYYYACSTQSSESCASGQFATTVAGDTTAPTVSGQVPSVGLTDVSINPEDLYVQFNEALDPTTIGSSNVLLCLTSDATCASPVSVGSPNLLENGTMIRIGGPSVTLSYATEYWIKITTGVKNLAGIELASPYGSITTSNFTTESAPTGSLSVTDTSMNEAKRFATGADFAHGWEWYIDVTVPTDEPTVKFKFGDLVGSGGTIVATSNVRYYSAQAKDGHTTEGTAIVAAGNDYSSSYLTFNATSDQDLTMAGWQVRVVVQAQNPSTLGGSFSTQFSVQSIAD